MDDYLDEVLIRDYGTTWVNVCAERDFVCRRM